MTRLAKLFLLVLGLAFPVLAGAQSPERQSPQTLRKEIVRTVELNYLLYLPPEYARADQRWPLVLFLHGAGERGTNLNVVTVHGPPKLIKAGTNFPFIVVSPQCPEGETWQADALIALIDEVMTKYKVDPKRVYATGLSMGGYGTWSLGISYPERFAAIAPICGGGDSIRLHLRGSDRSEPVKTMGIWAFHGAKDQVVRLEESERMVNAFKQTGNAARLTVYPEAEHDSWTETYANPELYTWLLQHQR